MYHCSLFWFTSLSILLWKISNFRNYTHPHIHLDSIINALFALSHIYSFIHPLIYLIFDACQSMLQISLHFTPNSACMPLARGQYLWLPPLLFKNIYLFIFRERGKEGERERNMMCERNSNQLPLSRPLLVTWPETHAAWLGIKPATLWSVGQSSIHWTTPAMVFSPTLKK